MASFTRRVLIDVGGDSIRIGEIYPDRRGLPVCSRLSSLELNIDPTKSAEWFPALLSSVESLYRESGIRPAPASVCFGGPSVFARVIKIPQANPTQVDHIIGFEAQQAVPAIEEACWDYQLFPADRGSGDLEAMILAIKKETVREVLAVCAKAKLKVEAVELAPMAIVNSFRYNYPDWNESTLILDIGARATNILIIEVSRIFCRVVPLGGASMTQAIATDLQESFAGAETLKKAKGFIHPGGSYEDPAEETVARISKLTRGVATRLHTEIERSITYYRSQQGGARPTRVLLAGGGASMGLTDFFFREKLKLPVQYFQPFRRVQVEGPIPQNVLQHPWGWASWVGNGLRNLPDCPCRMKILSMLEKNNNDPGENKPSLAIIAAVALSLLFLPTIHGFWQATKLDALLTPQASEIEEAERTIEKMQAEQKKTDAQLQELETAYRLKQEQSRWPLLLDELRDKIPPGVWLTQLSLLAPEGRGGEEGSKSSPEKTSSQAPMIELAGVFETKSEEADAQLVEQFRAALDSGKILQKVVTFERETPERSADGKTEQVALRFVFRAEWPEGSANGRSEETPKK